MFLRLQFLNDSHRLVTVNSGARPPTSLRHALVPGCLGTRDTMADSTSPALNRTLDTIGKCTGLTKYRFLTLIRLPLETVRLGNPSEITLVVTESFALLALIAAGRGRHFCSTSSDSRCRRRPQKLVDVKVDGGLPSVWSVCARYAGGP